MVTWTHPDIGEFAFDGYCWSKTLPLPAFNIFAQPCGRIPERRGEIDVYIWSVDQSDLPTSAVANLLFKVVRNHEILIPRFVSALVSEFRGTGPRTGMWWHGDVQSIEESIATLNELLPHQRKLTAESVERMLSPPTINIRDINGHGQFARWDDNATPIAEFGFSSPIDPEHGIGILTDGENILGIGYSGDARQFEVTPT